MLRGREQFSLETVLNSIQPNISFAQLLDCSLKLRAQLAHLLRSSVVKVKVANVKHTAPTVTTLADPETQNVECMYVRAWIGENRIGTTLVDGGAMINLGKVDVLRANNIPMFTVPNFGIRMADDSIHPLK
ncbi:Protein of unknown function [Pyronema omphalodes CBS 100304]|uniref:Uncharacterized protein n=1 Tax=Pyronema omphalodes (strain CBS 100304) TaxID=1076935 RepID=U4LFA0_PYROM|nr:Protein of unknown function [Pyronema omphalodes CBS 100304]